MAIKLPAHTCFIQQVMILAEGRGHWVNEEVREKASKIVEAYGALEFYDDTAQVDLPIEGPNVYIAGHTELIEKPKDPDKLKALLIETHQAVRGAWVPASIYRYLGESFQHDLGQEIEDEELKVAVRIANGLFVGSERSRNFNAEREVKAFKARAKERV